MNIEDIKLQLDQLYDQGQSQKAYELLLNQLNIAMNHQDDDTVLFLLNELIGYYRVTTQFELGNQVSLQAIRILENHQLSKSIIAATTFLNIATLYRSQGNYHQSLQYYHQCEKIYQLLLDRNDMRFAAFYNNFSLLYQETGDKEKALDYELKALQVIQKGHDNEFEEAVTYSNLSQIYFSLDKKEEGKNYLDKAILLFYKNNICDHHYFSALNALAQYHYMNHEYDKSIELYDEILDQFERTYGKTKDYDIVLKNKENVLKQIHNQHIKGLELCKRYYETYGKKMIDEKFSEYKQYMAIGLFGMGSDCLGYDDDISMDHDFGPGFCIIIPDNIYQKIGKELQREYDNLPHQFMNIQRIQSNHGQNRVGVFSINQMFGQFLQFIPHTLQEWLYSDENGLLACTNGEIFDDHYGKVTQIRETLKYYPEDIRIKKIVRAISKMAQSGQYNYSRCMQRGDIVAAVLALNEFIDQTLSCIYLLNKKYKPYYKWAFKGLDDCIVLNDLKELIKELTELPHQYSAWDNNHLLVNINDKKVILIEKICQRIITELHHQNLSDSTDDFLENHTLIIMNKIKDKDIRLKHIMEG